MPGPPPKTVLSDSEIIRILTLGHTGLKLPAIAKEVGRGQSTVSRILRIYDYETFNGHVLSCVRKRKTTKHEDRILIRAIKANDDQSFRDIIAISEVDVSCSTLHRRLKEVDLFNRIHRRKSVLKSHHIRARLHWARKHINWIIEQWIRVI
jgi:IS30 family transposase